MGRLVQQPPPAGADRQRAAGRSRSGLLPGAGGPHPNRRLTQMKQPPRKSVRFMSVSAHHLGTSGVKATPRVRSEQRSPWARFCGVATTSSYNTSDLRSFFDQCASTGCPEQHGHAQRLLDYRLALVRSLARPRSTDVVLDIGCGDGHHLLELSPEVALGIGIDISPGMIELARARLRGSPWRTKITFEVDDAEELKGIADQSIDLAICI